MEKRRVLISQFKHAQQLFQEYQDLVDSKFDLNLSLSQDDELEIMARKRLLTNVYNNVDN